MPKVLQATGAESVSISSVIAKFFSASLRLACNLLSEVDANVFLTLRVHAPSCASLNPIAKLMIW